MTRKHSKTFFEQRKIENVLGAAAPSTEVTVAERTNLAENGLWTPSTRTNSSDSRPRKGDRQLLTERRTTCGQPLSE